MASIAAERERDRYRPAVCCGGRSITKAALPDYNVNTVT